MKMYKIVARGTRLNFSIGYYFSTNYMDFSDFKYTGSEQEKYNKFLEDLQNNIAPQPIYIDVKLYDHGIDRGLARREVATIKNVNDFIQRLYT